MITTRNNWIVILAAGDGSRLAELTTGADGTHVPKQFCSLTGGEPLLIETLARARKLVDRERILVVVAAHHRRWWQPLLADLPAGNLIVQPCNRGTGNGVLLATWHVQRRDPAGLAVFLPADHHIQDERTVVESAREGIRWLQGRPSLLLLLGITPEEADPELGYIVPAEVTGMEPLPVRRFIEKPDRTAAGRLIAAGSLWNSFIFAARTTDLLDVFCRRHADLVEAMRLAVARDAAALSPGPALSAAYDSFPVIDFSRHVVQGAEDVLRVLPVPACGWTDLGTPYRIGECVRKFPKLREFAGRSPEVDPRWLNLARNYLEFSTAA